MKGLWIALLPLTCLSCDRGDRWGFVDRSGSLVVEARFEAVGPFAEDLAPAMLQRRWGFIDKTGSLVIPAVFASAESFSEGLALVSRAQDAGSGSVYGYIDHSGTFVVPAKYASARSFSQGLAVVRLPNGPFGYIDRGGDYVISPRFTEAMPFSESLAAVSTMESRIRQYGYVDRAGRFVIEPHFSRPSPFSNGVAAQNQGYIDKDGKVTLEPPTSVWKADFSEGLALTIQSGGLATSNNQVKAHASFIDNSGKEVLHVREATSFHEGLAASTADGYLWGFINRQGEFEIKPRWRKVGRFSEGLAAVCLGCAE
jgi:hypothetical protein